MEYNFSIQIDDEQHSLSSTDGISLKLIWELLRDLHKAIDIGSDANCTLSNIRGNCYALDFSTKEKKYVEKFIIVHKNINELSTYDLAPEENSYKQTLKKILGNKYYLNAYDSDKQKITTIKDLSKIKEIESYYTTKTIYGIVSELGSPKLSSNKKHIRIDGFSHKISISKEKDLELKNYYGTDKLRIKIKVKRALSDHRIISAEMLDFTKVSYKTLSENLKNTGYIDFALIKNTSTVDDIIDRIYNNEHKTN